MAWFVFIFAGAEENGYTDEVAGFHFGRLWTLKDFMGRCCFGGDWWEAILNFNCNANARLLE